MATHAETLEDGQFLVSRQGHYWRVSFYWQGAKVTTCAWLTREQAEAEASQRLRTLGGTSKAYRGLGGVTSTPPTSTLGAVAPNSLETMSVSTLKVLASSYGIPRSSKMRRHELIAVLRPLFEVRP